MAEIRDIYQGAPRDAPPPAPFSEYIGWLGKQDKAAAERHWRRVFERFEPPQSLSSLWRDGSGASGDGGYRYRREPLEPGLVAALELRARASKVTPSTLFQAAWALLLGRYCNSDDVVFGVTVAGRPAALAGVDAMIGMFINTLPARVRLDDGRSLTDWLQSLQTDRAEDRRFDHSALSDVQRWAGVDSGVSFLETLFVFENYPASEEANPSGLVFDSLEFHEQSNYPLSLLVVPGSPWRLILVHDPGRVSAPVVEQCMCSLVHILRQLSDERTATSAQVSACSPIQADRLRTQGQGRALDWSPGETVVRSFLRRAAADPEAVALEHAGAHITYRSLKAKVSKIAAELRAAGLGSNDVVPVLGASDPDTLAGILSVQAAGAAYLPLDASYPESRILEVLSALPDEHLGVGRPALAACPVPEALAVAGLRWLPVDSLAREADPGEHDVSRPDDLAYVIFTSGSTGGPKGVPVRHSNLAWSTRARSDHYDDSPQRFLLLSPLAFDSSIAGLFWTLTTGGALVLPSRHEIDNPAELAELLIRARVTHLLCLPSLWALLLDVLPDNARTDLMQVIVAGESCPPSLPRIHRRRFPAVRLDNEYGPTEGSVWCTAQRLDQRDWESVVPIGGPVPGVSLDVRDGARRRVPSGGLGELWLSGPGVVRGYLNDEPLTVTRFPETAGSGPRAYRTGDLVCWTDDGTLSFLGRADAQMKVRGHRVEPTDVEAVLNDHPAVRASGVLSVGGAALHALVEVPGEGSVDIGDLRHWLGRRLPPHLVPDKIQVTDALPTLPSGKLDRKALPSAVRAEPANEGAWRPGDGVEAAVLSLWQEVLGEAPADRATSFFQAGGHSLLCMRLLVEVDRRFGRRITLAAFLEDPTLRGLERLVREGGPVSRWRSLVPVKPTGSRTPFFCIHGDPTALAPHIDPETPYYWLHHAQAPGNVEYATVETLARDHLVEIRSIQPAGPYRLAGYSFGGLLAYEIARLLSEDGEKVDLLALIEPTQQAQPRQLRSYGSVRAQGSIARRRSLAQRVKRRWFRALNRLKMARCRYYVRAHRTMPHGLRNFHMVQLFADAGKAYSYPPFEGSAVLFFSAKSVANRIQSDAMLAHWDAICGRGIELAVVDAVPAHTDLFREPYVAALAERLNGYLDQG